LHKRLRDTALLLCWVKRRGGRQVWPEQGQLGEQADELRREWDERGGDGLQGLRGQVRPQQIRQWGVGQRASGLEAAPWRTMQPWLVARALPSATGRDLPTPASPAISATCPCPLPTGRSGDPGRRVAVRGQSELDSGTMKPAGLPWWLPSICVSESRSSIANRGRLAIL
jgi:hypothetical protein